MFWCCRENIRFDPTIYTDTMLEWSEQGPDNET